MTDEFHHGTGESRNTTSGVYRELVSKIQEDPYAEGLWSQAVGLAQDEELSGSGAKSFYSNVPLVEIISIGQRLRSTKSRNEQYQILTERTSDGEQWYDIVLGHVNEKMFVPIEDRLRELSEANGRKWEEGLDVGTGTGDTLRSIAPYFNNVTGIDILKGVLPNTKDTLPKNAQVVAGDVTRLPFKDNIFNIAVSNGLTHYLSRGELRDYIQELSRVLKPGGLFYASFVAQDEGEPLTNIEKEYLSSGKALLVCLLDNLVSQTKGEVSDKWTLNDMVEMANQAGFEYGVSEGNEDGTWFIEFGKVTQ